MTAFLTNRHPLLPQQQLKQALPRHKRSFPLLKIVIGAFCLPSILTATGKNIALALLCVHREYIRIFFAKKAFALRAAPSAKRIILPKHRLAFINLSFTSSWMCEGFKRAGCFPAVEDFVPGFEHSFQNCSAPATILDPQSLSGRFFVC